MKLGSIPNTLLASFLPSLTFKFPISLPFSHPGIPSSGTLSLSLSASTFQICLDSLLIMWYNDRVMWVTCLVQCLCFITVESISALLYWINLYLHKGLLKFAVLVWCAGRKALVIRMQSIDHRIEPISSNLMASEKESEKLVRNLYPQIEPYSTGFLKVSDLHTIYWEQSGNPSGHVSSNWLASNNGLNMYFFIFSIHAVGLYVYIWIKIGMGGNGPFFSGSKYKCSCVNCNAKTYLYTCICAWMNLSIYILYILWES